jgi:hypothetical protein
MVLKNYAPTYQLGTVHHSARLSNAVISLHTHNAPSRKAEVIEAEGELKALQRHAFAIVNPEAFKFLIGGSLWGGHRTLAHVQLHALNRSGSNQPPI